MEQEWLKTEEVMKILGISSRQTIYNLVKAGKLQIFHKVASPRRAWFKREDVEALAKFEPGLMERKASKKDELLEE